MGLYINIGEYDEALKHLALREDILRKVIEETPQIERNKYNNYWLETCLGYTDIYWALRDKENLKKYLLKTKEYFHPNCFYSIAISYHSNWANYYRLNKE